MPVFAIVSATDPAKLLEAIERKFQDNFIELPRGSGWLVAAPGNTAQQVSDTLGISEKAIGQLTIVTGGFLLNHLWDPMMKLLSHVAQATK